MKASRIEEYAKELVRMKLRSERVGNSPFYEGQVVGAKHLIVAMQGWEDYNRIAARATALYEQDTKIPDRTKGEAW